MSLFNTLMILNRTLFVAVAVLAGGLAVARSFGRPARPSLVRTVTWIAFPVLVLRVVQFFMEPWNLIDFELLTKTPKNTEIPGGKVRRSTRVLLNLQ